MSAHDRHLTQYRHSPETVWCSNPACPNHSGVGVEVTYESEYGQGWYTPEECECGGEWLEDEPKDEDLAVLGRCPHGVDLDREFCPQGCRV